MWIAWCKDRELGNDIGYVIEMTDSQNAPKGNYFWAWNVDISALEEEGNARICVDLLGEKASVNGMLIAKNITAFGNWSLIEGDDGNFYICQVLFEDVKNCLK